MVDDVCQHWFLKGHAVGLSVETDGLLCKIDGEFFNRLAICEVHVLTVGWLCSDVIPMIASCIFVVSHQLT